VATSQIPKIFSFRIFGAVDGLLRTPLRRLTKQIPAPRVCVFEALPNDGVIVCVSAAGETLIPYMVTSQDSVRLSEALKKRGVRFGQT
jgi:hypothetical protein